MPNIIFSIPLYFTGITTYIYTELAPKLTATASVAQSVERWFRDPGSMLFGLDNNMLLQQYTISLFQQPWRTLLLHHWWTILLKQCLIILLVIYVCILLGEYLTNRLHFSVRVFCNRSQILFKKRKDKVQQHKTKSRGVTVVHYTLWCLPYTRMVKCNLCFIQ